MKQQRIRAWITFLITFAMLFSIGNSYRSTAENNILSAEEKTYSDVTESSQALSLADQCSILNYIDEKEFMANGFTKRVFSEEELNTYIFERDDGTRGLYMFGEDVKFEDASGNVLEKDISLEKTYGGYTTKQNNVGLLLPDRITNGIKISFDEEELILFAPEGNNIESEKNGNSVKYVNAYGKNAHLVLTPTLSGLKQDIVLDNYTGQNRFDIIVVSESLKPFYDKEGSLFFAKTESDDYRFNVSSVFIYDSFGHFSGGDIHIEQIAINKWHLTLLVPEEFLVSDNTVYPVTIDPKIEKKSGANSSYIEDTTIYSGKPNLVTGTWTYNHTGFLSDGYNKGRMLVRTPGLYNDPEFSGIQASQIDSAKFYIKEATGSASQEVKLYAYTGVSWSENTATWNNTSPNGSYTLIDTKYPSYGDYAEYNVTNLIKGWKNGTYSASLGFMLKSSDESNVSNAKAFDASESAYSNVQPYIVVYYRPQLFLFSYAVDLNEGESFANLAITDPTTTVQWTSSNPTVATVNSAGVITGVRASATPVTITATLLDPYGPALSKTCTVYVKIPNGVYHIKNLNSNFYLHVNNGGISNLTDVIQYYKYLDNADDIYRIRQMWKVFYLGNGRYSIRPLSKLDKGLDVTGGNVDIYNIGTSDTLSNVPNYGEWTIDCYSSGYVFKNNGSDNLTMQVNNGSYSLEASVVASTYSTNSNCRWSLTPVFSPPSGVYWFDTNSNSFVLGNPTDSKYIIYGSPYDIDDLGLIAIAYSPDSISQSFSWYSSNVSIANIDSCSGVINGLISGKITITGYKSGSNQNLSFDLIVIGADQYNAGVRIAQVNGKQYYDYTIPINDLFDDAVTLCEDHRCLNWEQYCTWAYGISIIYETSLSEFYGMQLGSFLWFYGQVNHGKVWDIKLENRWNAALPNVPYLINGDGSFGEFIFRGATTTAEGLGNIMYGYTGRATGFGEITLYWGGGVAAQGSVNSSLVTQPPYYGDTIEDHNNINHGFDMFNEDYPDYPDVGFDGIPVDGLLADIADALLNPGT